MSEENQGVQGRTIVNVPVLNLSTISSADELSHISAIENVGMILVPEEFVGAVSLIPMKNVGGIHGVAQGEKVRVNTLVGQLTLTGDVLQNPDELVALAGTISFVGPLTSVKCRLVVAGQLIAPEESRQAISAALLFVGGQIFYYKGKALRTSFGTQTLGREFLSYLSEPTAFFAMGALFIEDDVTPDIFREKVADIISMGAIIAPKALHPVIQAVCSQQFGALVDSAKGGDEGENEDDDAD